MIKTRFANSSRHAARCLGVFAWILAGVAVGCSEKPGDGASQTPPGAGTAGDASRPDAPAPEHLVIQKFCSGCHRLAPPGILPRASWRTAIERMYTIYEERVVTTSAVPPPIEATVEYYVSRAPQVLPAVVSTSNKAPGPVKFRPLPRKIGGLPPYPGVSNVQLVHLIDTQHLEILLCEMRFSRILLLQPAMSLREVLQLGTARHPSHAEVVDLDNDGVRDVLVSSLGTVTPSDTLNGAVVWLRGLPDRKFESITLAAGLGRVADAQAADFDGDGDRDVVVAVFGWRKVGRIIWLENQTRAGGEPRFVPHEIDPRPGTTNVPVIDLNGDGRPAFIALISQQFETVVAFLNLGEGIFEPRTLFTAEHPNWGSSGIDLVDLDQDGDEDILFANGDSLDDLLFKNYHGIQWLENKGELRFDHHRLTDLCGAHSVRAGDFDGDGDLDLVAGSFLPFLRATTPNAGLVESLVWLEQVAPGQFERHPLEAVTCFHPTLDVGDLDGDGDDDIVVGNMSMAKKDGDDMENWITIWENVGVRGNSKEK